jgi:hypothetical protein
MIKEQGVAECDATTDAITTKARYIKKLFVQKRDHKEYDADTKYIKSVSRLNKEHIAFSFCRHFFDYITGLITVFIFIIIHSLHVVLVIQRSLCVLAELPMPAVLPTQDFQEGLDSLHNSAGIQPFFSYHT